ncbi:MAG: hypothetical protein VKP62_02925, partial [Candidatus Sericytochromatia bacterium]|nr:hypothetical protein [Candidatus Sericytochromatia bacterium]
AAVSHGWHKLVAQHLMAGAAQQAADLPLFAPETRARATDPVTSHQAAERAAPAASGQRACVLAVLRQYGDLTYREIDQRLNWHTGAQRRLPELERLGLARPTGDERDGCRVWTAMEAA